MPEPRHIDSCRGEVHHQGRLQGTAVQPFAEFPLRHGPRGGWEVEIAGLDHEQPEIPAQTQGRRIDGRQVATMGREENQPPQSRAGHGRTEVVEDGLERGRPERQRPGIRAMLDPLADAQHRQAQQRQCRRAAVHGLLDQALRDSRIRVQRQMGPVLLYRAQRQQGNRFGRPVIRQAGAVEFRPAVNGHALPSSASRRCASNPGKRLYQVAFNGEGCGSGWISRVRAAPCGPAKSMVSEVSNRSGCCQ